MAVGICGCVQCSGVLDIHLCGGGRVCLLAWTCILKLSHFLEVSSHVVFLSKMFSFLAFIFGGGLSLSICLPIRGILVRQAS